MKASQCLPAGGSFAGSVSSVRSVRLGDVIGLHQDFRRGPLARAADDVLIFVVRAIDVEDQQVGLERIQVRLRRLHEHLRGEAAEGAVLDDEIGVRKTPPQIVLDQLRPLLLGDGLAVEQDAHRVPLLRRARGQQAHRALDVASPTARVGKFWRWVGLGLGSAGHTNGKAQCERQRA